MITPDQRRFLDLYSRVRLIEQSKLSDKCTDSLIKYIMYEMAYSDVVLATFSRSFPLLEQGSDEDYNAKIRQLETSLAPALAAGFAGVAGGNIQNGSPPSNTRGVANTGRGFNAKVTEYEGFDSPASVVSKMCFLAISKINQACKTRCAGAVSQSDKTTKSVVTDMCMARCGSNGIQRLISDLTSNVSRCSNTANPDSCKTILVNKIKQYKEKLRDSERNFSSLRSKFQDLQNQEARTTEEIR